MSSDIKPGDKVRVGVKKGKGGSLCVKWRKGEVIAVYDRFIVVQLERYCITVSKWEMKDGTIKIERERKAV